MLDPGEGGRFVGVALWAGQKKRMKKKKKQGWRKPCKQSREWDLAV